MQGFLYKATLTFQPIKMPEYYIAHCTPEGIFDFSKDTNVSYERHPAWILCKVFWYAEHRVFLSLKKYQVTAVPKLLSLSVVDHGIASHLGVLRCRLIHLALLHCGKMLCTTGRGVRGDGCRKTQGLSEKRGDNLGFLGLCRSSPAGTMARAEGTCCEE